MTCRCRFRLLQLTRIITLIDLTKPRHNDPYTQDLQVESHLGNLSGLRNVPHLPVYAKSWNSTFQNRGVLIPMREDPSNVISLKSLPKLEELTTHIMTKILRRTFVRKIFKTSTKTVKSIWFLILAEKT